MAESGHDDRETPPATDAVPITHRLIPTPIESPRAQRVMNHVELEVPADASNASVVQSIAQNDTPLDVLAHRQSDINPASAASDKASGGRGVPILMGPPGFSNIDDAREFNANDRPTGNAPAEPIGNRPAEPVRNTPAGPVGTGAPHRPLAGPTPTHADITAVDASLDALGTRLLRRLRTEQAAAQFRARANAVE